VGRFLALLELYREAVVAFEQITPLGDLTIRWTGNDDGEIQVTEEFDEEREVDRNAVDEEDREQIRELEPVGNASEIEEQGNE
jgi:segregation and condensation protein A